jgi:hypothetical protein
LKIISALCKMSGVVCFVGALIPVFAILVIHPDFGTSAALSVLPFSHGARASSWRAYSTTDLAS